MKKLERFWYAQISGKSFSYFYISLLNKKEPYGSFLLFIFRIDFDVNIP